MGLLADPLSMTMCLVVTGIGWLIMLYSTGYMKGDPRYSRFFAYLSLFFTAMLLLVLADNFLLLYVGWELVGLCSYLLISFWFEKPAAARAGIKAFLTTKVGDLGLLAGILLMAKLVGDLGFHHLSENTVMLGKWAPIIGLLIFWGAVGKSAQFPLHVWLPDAMEGPTPVSALIHAATMVAAGVYLVARSLPLLMGSPESRLVVAGIGAITSFFAATIACTQTDLKKILAYSTISQLGYMMLGLGCGTAFTGMFHLVTHAWFKALLFLGAGSVIHAVHHQDITRMGGLIRPMPITAVTFIAAAVAMVGIPPFSGFWSKEEILIHAAGFSSPGAPWIGTLLVWVGLVTACLTSFYITRAVVLTFFGKSHEPGETHAQSAGAPGSASDSRSHESPWVMTGPLLVLSVGALGVGLLGSPWGGHWLQHFIGMEENAAHVGTEWISTASILAAVIGISYSILRYGWKIQVFPAAVRNQFSPIYWCVFNKYYVDEFYNTVLIGPIVLFSRRAFVFDGGVIDGIVNLAGRAGLWMSRLKGRIDQVVVDGAGNGIGEVVGRAGERLRLLQTGLVQNYLLVASCGAIALFLVMRCLF